MKPTIQDDASFYAMRGSETYPYGESLETQRVEDRVNTLGRDINNYLKQKHRSEIFTIHNHNLLFCRQYVYTCSTVKKCPKLDWCR